MIGQFDSYDWWCIGLGLCYVGGTPHRRSDCSRHHDVRNAMDGLCWQGGVLHRREDCRQMHGDSKRRVRRCAPGARQAERCQ